MRVLGFMITRPGGRRKEVCESTISTALETSGYHFDLHLHVVGYVDKGEVPKIKCKGGVEGSAFTRWPENVGQHVIMNSMITKADEEGYDLLLRIDDDIKFLTKRWLAKMVEASGKLGEDFILSPTVQGLIHPPPTTDKVEKHGVTFKLATEVMGGACRLHHIEALKTPGYEYVSDVRKPLGFGDATGIGEWCAGSVQKEDVSNKWMAYLSHVRVKHSTSKMMKDDEEYYKEHDLFQHIPYIPSWGG